MPWSEEDENLETLKKELSEADQTLHETLNKMNKIKEVYEPKLAVKLGTKHEVGHFYAMTYCIVY